MDLLLLTVDSLCKCCMSCNCSIAAKFVGSVNNSPRNSYTSFRPTICSTLSLWLFYVGITTIIYANLFIHQGVSPGQNRL